MLPLTVNVSVWGLSFSPLLPLILLDVAAFYSHTLTKRTQRSLLFLLFSYLKNHLQH